MTRVGMITLALSALVLGCGSSEAHPDATPPAEDAGPPTADAQTEADSGSIADSGPTDAASPADPCAERARRIYLLARGGVLLGFTPEDGRFEEIGVVACPGRGPEVRPISMAVDRRATAWVHFGRGDVFHVSTEDASCRPSPFDGLPAGFVEFGMGFAAEAPGSSRDILFLAAASDFADPETRLGRVDRFGVERVGPIAGLGELTGTADGRLFGFFPYGDAPTVRQLDPTSGATLAEYPTTLRASGGNAFAFAHWGGSFYIFFYLDSEGGPGSDVYRFDPRTGATFIALEDAPYVVVGAGVSTCAPLE